MLYRYIFGYLMVSAVAFSARSVDDTLKVAPQVLLRQLVQPTPYSNSSIPQSTGSCASYWLENIKHQGVASFNTDTGYQIFRNVKDYGAKGDGKTDDTAAIQRAISSGNRCAPGVCESTTRTPAVVYFPGGTYLISASIIDYYYTQVNLSLHSFMRVY